jgi:F-type H+-transporting ATPase subunit epsilon
MADRLQVSVVTPTGTMAQKQLDEVIAPGELGELGVLPGHVPLLAALRPGVLTLRDGGRRELFAVGPGFLQVALTGEVKVLVERAIAPTDVDVAEARKELAAAEAEVKNAAGKGLSTVAAQAAFDWAEARVKAAEHRA